MIARLIQGCWIAFALYWLISARFVKRTSERQSRLSSLAHRLPLALGALLILPVRLPAPLGWELDWHPWFFAWLGCALCVLGLAGAVWSRRTLAGNWSGDVTFKEGHELIARGPYRLVRHPIYTSILLLFLGTATAERRLGSFAGVLVCLAALWVKIKQEERLMLRHFPDQYSAYRARVSALIPFVL